MSGGHFEYKNDSLQNEIFGWSDKPSNVFEDKEISELIWDVFNLIHDFDRYKSGDTGEEDYIEAKKKFKNKWLKNDEERTKRIIDETLQQAKDELYKTFLGDTANG